MKRPVHRCHASWIRSATFSARCTVHCSRRHSRICAVFSSSNFETYSLQAQRMFGRGHFENDIAANVCVLANDYTVPAPVRPLAHLNANTVCHVKFLCHKSVRRGRNLVAALPRRGDLHCYGRQFLGLATTVSGFDGVLSANWVGFA